METLAFLWDQYFITGDVPDFAEELLSAVAAATIIVLRDYLFQCHEVREVKAVERSWPHLLTCRRLKSKLRLRLARELSL
jgi:hypothetical protein